jgi:iodotyrosine deiodinase
MKKITKPSFIPFKNYVRYSEGEMKQRSGDFYKLVNRRRTIRNFSDKNVPREIIENCVKAAGTAPSGANLQPWHFVIISDPNIKKQIRTAAEKEELEFYTSRAPKEWLNALKKLGTTPEKSFLETAPFLIAVFSRSYDINSEGKKRKNYYPVESAGIACGILITAIHYSGLAALTHTPSPMKFLNKILNRPVNEKPFLILVVGYPAENAEVPDIKRKPFEEISNYI